jgi:agmatine deiminase
MAACLAACGGAEDESSTNTRASPAPSAAPAAPAAPLTYRMPDEAERHLATWMSFVAKPSVWGSSLQAPVQGALARIANAIADFEPVKMLVGTADMANARRLCSASVQLIAHEMDDLWTRDTGCVFVRGSAGARAAVSFNFNGWGNRQVHGLDRGTAARMAAFSGVPLLRSTLVLEGGGIEVDGQGTAIITESCMLNANRNPGVSKATAEVELKGLLGLEKIIWLPGIKGRDITDGHTDFYARFVKPGVVVAALDNDPASYDYAVTRRHLELLRTASDAQRRPLQVVTLTAPTRLRPAHAQADFAAGYLNFYVTDKALFLPEFGDAESDLAARQALASLLPQHQMVAINIDPIAAGGGGIHCTTQQEPA